MGWCTGNINTLGQAQKKFLSVLPASVVVHTTVHSLIKCDQFLEDSYIALHCLLTDFVHVRIIHVIKTSWVGLRSRFGERSVEKVVVSLQYLFTKRAQTGVVVV